MARQPEVFVRELDPSEAQRLVKITRTARDRVRLRRSGIVLASMQGRTAAEAAAMFAATAQYAREVIQAFNEQGFAALDPKWSGGRPRKFGSVAREIVCRVAKTAPQQLGLPFTTWSLTQAGRVPGQGASDRGQRGDGAPGPARGLDQLAGEQDMESQPRPAVRGEDGPHPRVVRPGRRRADPRRRAGDLRGRVRPAQPATPTGSGLVPPQPGGSKTSPSKAKPSADPAEG